VRPWLWWLLLLLLVELVVVLLATIARLELPLLPAGTGLAHKRSGLPSRLAGGLLPAPAACCACCAAGGQLAPVAGAQADGLPRARSSGDPSCSWPDGASNAPPLELPALELLAVMG